MKRFFFSKEIADASLSDRLMRLVFSLLDPASQSNASQVCSYWNAMVKSTRLHAGLLDSVRKTTGKSDLGIHQIEATRLSGGMTNQTWLLEFYGFLINSIYNKAVLRIPGEGSAAFVDREDEEHNATVASRLGLNVRRFFSNKQGLQLTYYVENAATLHPKLLENDLVLTAVAQMMKKLHTSQEDFKSKMDVFKVVRDLISGLKNKSFSFPDDFSWVLNQLNNLEQLFSSYEIQWSPCHNDPTPGNFLWSLPEDKEPGADTPFYQTDWEYSNMNDLMWDLAYFSELATLDTKQQLFLLKAYFDKEFAPETRQKSILAWFAVYKPVVQLWITLWSWSQLINKANAVDTKEYEDLGKSAYTLTRNHFGSTDYKNALDEIGQEINAAEHKVLRPF